MTYGSHCTSVRRNLDFLTPADRRLLAPTPREIHAIERAAELTRQLRGELVAPTLLDRSIRWVRRLQA